MEFADDIAIGNFTSADFDEFIIEDDNSGRAKRVARVFSGFKLSLVVSLVLHFALASTLLYFAASEFERAGELDSISIRVEFVSSNPLLSQAEEIVPQTPSEATAPIPLPETVSELPVAESPQEDNFPETSESEMAETSSAENPGANILRPVEAVTLPSVESVQSVLSNLQRNDISRFYTHDCNKLEEEKEFSDCAPRDTRDYSALTRNPVYESHKSEIEYNQSRETVTTLARQSAGVSEQLALSELPPGLSSYVLEELEQGIETYSNNSSRALNHMNTMVDKSAAGAMARNLFDYWVQQQTAQLQSRRVESRSDRLFRQRCRSYEKFIMSPATVARCLSVGETPFGFSFKF